MKNIITSLLIMACLFSGNSYAKTPRYSEIFESCNAEGVVLLYQQSSDKWLVTDESVANHGSLPASTFKIMNSLIALDTGVAKAGEVFLWDGIEREYSPWNSNLSLEEAFKHSAVWVHERINSRLDANIYKRYLQWSDYGDGNILNGKPNNFWVYGDFAVTPKQQVSLLVKLYNNELPFSKVTTDHVKQMMITSDEVLGQVYAKTGWTRQNGKHIGWWIGYIEEDNNQPLFFATRVTRNENENFEGFLECRKSITRNIIQSYLK